MARNFSSTAGEATLTSGISSTQTSISVSSTNGFPVPPFAIAVGEAPQPEELMLVQGMDGLTLTVARGYDSTPRTQYDAGALVRHVHMAMDFRQAALHVEATVAHGATGAVVGTTNAQVLINKNLSDPSNIFPTGITGFLVPPGAGMEWYTDTPPPGWLLLDGSTHSRTVSEALWVMFQINSTQFRVPDRRGRVGVGRDTRAGETDFNGNIGRTGGEKRVQLTQGQMPAHSHSMTEAPAHSHAGATVWAGEHNHGYEGPSILPAGYGQSSMYRGREGKITTIGGGHQHAILPDGNHVHTIHNTGNSEAHNNMQPYVVVNYIIKA